MSEEQVQESQAQESTAPDTGRPDHFSSPEKFRAHLEAITQEEEPEAPEPVTPDPDGDDEPEAADSDDVEIAEEEKIPAKVPSSRLKEEANRRREAEERAARAEAEAAYQRKQYEELQRGLEKFAQKAEEEPSEEELEQQMIDPDSYRLLKQKMQKELDARDQRIMQIEANMVKAQYEAIIAGQEAEFIKAVPDYKEAASHALISQVEEMMQREGVDKQTAVNEVAKWYHTTVFNACRSGQSVPDLLYRIAKFYNYEGPAKEKHATGLNIEAIDRNKRKTSSLGAIQGSSAPASGGTKLDIKKAMDDDGRIDPDKFHRLVASVR